MDGRYLSDAAHFPGGHAAAIAVPRTTAEIPAIVRAALTLLPVGAQSSLTGGATPMGEIVLSTEKLARILDIGGGSIRVEAGVPIASIQHVLASHDAWFPPVPTFTGAFAGGTVATNAAGAATFRHGSVRPWVQALDVVLADGSELTIVRGEHTARDGRLRVPTTSGTIEVPVPAYRMPRVDKVSAGYFAAPGMDLIDLFIGSEGTLGVVATVTFRTASPVPTTAMALVPCASEPDSIALAADLRREPSVAAIEHMDRRCLEILHEDGADRRCDVAFPSDTAVALLVQLQLTAGTTEEQTFEQIQDGRTDSAIGRVCASFRARGVFDQAQMALPGNVRRAEQFLALREAVPTGVNQRVGRAQQEIDPRIVKTAADMIVPFERFAEMMTFYRDAFASRGLDFAVWGHISDGNVHPNVIPHSYADVERGTEAILALGREVVRLGGCPLAEHGVGRHPVKQALLRQLYGHEGIAQMRAVKRALDRDWKLAPGVIFDR
ncbi:MAG TPA: FAD-binding oxidoreductase [Vicinamibacterales bacterium]|nr:FAD-binding oxidoreductase [Vicinamibacterales bacterium]